MLVVMKANDIAAAHRQALIESGWVCGEITQDAVGVGFEIYSGLAEVRSGRRWSKEPVKPHRRSFAATGEMTVTRHG